MPLVEIKDFNKLNELSDNKLFFDRSVKRKQAAYHRIVEVSKKDDYATGNLLGYLYHQKYFKLIDRYLSRQTNTSISQQINFVGKLEQGDSGKMFFIAEKQ